ncbi:hypothetical protein NIES593_07050 [Hydrococcus rivularis NIES-593]|uniref:Uncharacterized protein n=1 Tax=Hydrococcus rivularis NIES-593 TaxID=1921803 RepID=A0A1U7HLG7_9CYAN|nr:hypothetical protein NIES593_07050 [Hydrococcus rivularis NIES-593]
MLNNSVQCKQFDKILFFFKKKLSAIHLLAILYTNNAIAYLRSRTVEQEVLDLLDDPKVTNNCDRTLIKR